MQRHGSNAVIKRSKPTKFSAKYSAYVWGYVSQENSLNLSHIPRHNFSTERRQYIFYFLLTINEPNIPVTISVYCKREINM